MTDELLIALNRIFWKLQLPRDMSCKDFGEYLAAELRDGDVVVYWNNPEEKFVRDAP